MAVFATSKDQSCHTDAELLNQMQGEIKANVWVLMRVVCVTTITTWSV